MNEFETLALQYLPSTVAREIYNYISIHNGNINEIRLRLNKPLFITQNRCKIELKHVCTKEQIEHTVNLLCEGSLYSYADYIKDGVIPTKCGIRAGVCGKAVVRGDTISCVRDITSINIRIPSRIKGAANDLYELVKEHGGGIVYSPPGEGKTTLLRELIPLLSNAENNVSVIDTRYELSALMEDCISADFFLGYPRPEGISSAIRTMSPDYIICDEIFSSSDADAILNAYSAGVRVVASAHAHDFNQLSSNANIKKLLDNGVFAFAYSINRSGNEVKLLNE